MKILFCVILLWLAIYWIIKKRFHRQKTSRMKVSFKEINTMQTIQLHPSKTYDLAGSAVDTNGDPILLTNLDFSPVSGPLGTAGDDVDPTDDNDTLITVADLNATGELNFTADGPNGRKFVAKVQGTIVAPEVVLEDMAIIFTEKK